jgi:glutamate-ammonia-ligase adenylyltransferase
MNSFNALIQPDLFSWERLEAALAETGLDGDKRFVEELQRLALASNYAATQLGKYPDLLNELHHCTDWQLDEATLEQSLQDLVDENAIKQQLRLFRHRKMLRILYLDQCLDAAVEDTLQRLTDLADALIRQALARAEALLSAKHGQPFDQLGDPMQLNIIGMGKLGGGELNFSSDIDLICVYAEEGQLKGFGQHEHSQYFANVTRLFKKLLNDATADGFVYRVDLRLRPWGDSGPPVLSHAAFEHYYQLHGREWEQYAMVKARVITGSDSDRKYLQSILRPFVYRRYHDYRVFDGLAQLKKKIDQQARSKHELNNLKTGRGGIREIEFYVQAFQILKGGRNHSLQTPSLFQAMRVIDEQNITEHDELDTMRSAYCFLRRLENHVQMMDDQQTHDIPTNENHRQRIAIQMGFADWDALDIELQRRQAQVSSIFESLFVQQDQASDKHDTPLHLNEIDADSHLKQVRELGFADCEDIHARLQAFYASKAFLFMSDKAKQRFHCFFPRLLKLVARQPSQLELLDKMLSLLSSIAGRSVYFELLYQHETLMEKLVDLFNGSNWIASEVTRYPMLLESILYPEHLENRFDPDYLAHSLKVQLHNISGDIELELDVLRQFKRAHTIEIASASLADEIDSAQVANHLSQLAGIILRAVYDLAWRELTASYGSPRCRIEGETRTAGFAILAYGKLGGRELHYQSDLDIVFVHDSDGDEQVTDGDKAIDNSMFFARLGQKIISKITLLTPAGKLYEIDTRLRPDGASGMLSSPLQVFRHYQLNNAWVWEHQALVRARWIAGNPDLNAAFENIRREVIQQPRQDAELKREIVNMRQRMYEAKKPPEGETINIKHSRGCMVDIEFMVQYLVLRHANKFASLCESTDNIGLIGTLFDLGLISNEDRGMADVYQTYHRWLQALVIQDRPAELPRIQIEREIALVRQCWDRMFSDVSTVA